MAKLMLGPNETAGTSGSDSESKLRVDGLHDWLSNGEM